MQGSLFFLSYIRTLITKSLKSTVALLALITDPTHKISPQSNLMTSSWVRIHHYFDFLFISFFEVLSISLKFCSSYSWFLKGIILPLLLCSFNIELLRFISFPHFHVCVWCMWVWCVCAQSTSAHVEVRGQPWVLILTFCLVILRQGVFAVFPFHVYGSWSISF